MNSNLQFYFLADKGNKTLAVVKEFAAAKIVFPGHGQFGGITDIGRYSQKQSDQ